MTLLAVGPGQTCFTPFTSPTALSHHQNTTVSSRAMGAGASALTVPEEIDQEICKRICGDLYNDDLFNSLKDERGFVSKLVFERELGRRSTNTHTDGITTSSSGATAEINAGPIFLSSPYSLRIRRYNSLTTHLRNTPLLLLLQFSILKKKMPR